MYIIKNSSLEDINANLPSYTNAYLEYGLLAFDKIKISQMEQLDVMKSFSKTLDWQWFSTVDTEDHSVSFDLYGDNVTSKDVFIPWHLEHVERPNPQVCATWNMNKITCDNFSGSTGFVDARILYERLPSEWKLFLDNVFVINPESKSLERRCVQRHKNNNKNILKLSPYAHKNAIVRVKDSQPSLSDLNLFREINEWFSYQVLCVEKDKIWWNWSEGDLLLVDLSSMIHCVKGGFFPGERIFSRYWGYEKKEDFMMYSNMKFNERHGLKNG